MTITNTRIAGLLELAELTHQEILDQAPRSAWGAIALCGDHDQIEMIQRDNVTTSGVPTFLSHWDAYDAIIDAAAITTDPDAFGSIQAAIDANHVSMFVNKATEPGAITIASGDNVQRIVGKDADTTAVPVDIVCNKADVTFENLLFNDVNLTINATGCRVTNCFFTGTAVLTLDATDCLVEDSRFKVCSVIPLVIVEGSNRIERNTFIDITAAHAISLDSDGSDIQRIVIADNTIAPLPGTVSDYLIKSQGSTGTDEIRNSVFINNTLGPFTTGGISIFGDGNRITNNLFQAANTMPTTDRCVELDSTAGVDINTTVDGNIFNPAGAANRLIE